jgi:hypothetical protein
LPGLAGKPAGGVPKGGGSGRGGGEGGHWLALGVSGGWEEVGLSWRSSHCRFPDSAVIRLPCP